VLLSELGGAIAPFWLRACRCIP